MGTDDVEMRLAVLVRSVLPDASLELTANTDLYGAGLDSAGILTLVSLLEDEFDVELDDDAISRARFASLTAIADLFPR